MRPFVDKFPELGQKETRVITVLQKGDEGSLPLDQYAFVELYCTEKDCDCRRVMISVFANDAGSVVATINMGFDEQDAHAGPFLDPLNAQSKYSSKFMEHFLDMINNDPGYLARLQRHYVMFKEKIDGKPYRGRPFESPGKGRRVKDPPGPHGQRESSRSAEHQKPVSLEGDRPQPVRRKPKVGRNQPCPCGSGKKYKKCCMLKPQEGKTTKGAVSTGQREKSSKKPDDGKDLGDLSVESRDINRAKAMVKTITKRLKRDVEDNLLDKGIVDVLEKNPKIASALLHLLLKSHARKEPVKKPSANYRAILILIEEALTQIRYSVERDRQWAIDAAERIQKEIAAKAFQLKVDTRVQADLVQALHSSRLELHPEIKAKRDELAEYYTRFTARSGLPDFDRLFDSVASGGPNNPFELYEQMMADLTLLPLEGQLGAIAEMAKAGNPLIREIASFMLLHPDRQIRVLVPAIFDNLIDQITIDPVTLRRMIGLRNWLPNAERPGLDKVIKEARLARVECAPMPRIRSVKAYVSPFDGAGMQGAWVIAGTKRAYEMASVLVRQGQGIREAWGEAGLTKEEVKSSVRGFTKGGVAEPVEPAYLEDLVPHFIWVGQQHDSSPPPELLQVAESMGTYWHPKPLVFEKKLAALENASEPLTFNNEYLDKVLEESRAWPEMPFATSWFEDDARVDDLLKKNSDLPFGSPGMIAQTRDLIVKEILEDKRDAWSERLLWMALWARAHKGRNRLPWQPFLVIAREVRHGAPLDRIPLMGAIAERSVYSAIRRMKEFPE